MELNEQQLDVAKEVVNISLAKVGDMLSFFMKQRVLIKSSDIFFESFDEHSVFTKLSHESITCLKTEVRGEFSGNCYLLFSEEQKEKLLQIILPEPIYKNPESKKLQGDALLLEIDNIASASVVTQFSNLLGYKMFGYVPQLFEKSTHDINTFLFNDNKSLSSVMRIKTDFTANRDKIEPEFIWFMDKTAFLNGIKNII
jgi:chemotaxis protein CheY-P-specific phosphatase CheC